MQHKQWISAAHALAVRLENIKSELSTTDQQRCALATSEWIVEQDRDRRIRARLNTIRKDYQ